VRGVAAVILVTLSATGCGRIAYESHVRPPGDGGGGDAGTGTDAAIPNHDGGPGPDAGVPLDDAGSGMDAMIPLDDAGSATDAAPPADAGSTTDATPPADAGSALDATPPADAGSALSPFVATIAAYPETDDLDAACRGEIGAASRVADWTELTAYYASGGDMAALLADGWPVNGAQALVLNDGAGIWSGTRHYFVERHDHVTPGYFLVHDNIDTNLLDLGSWYGFSMKVLCTR